MPNTRVPVIQQRLNSKAESICFKCFHRNVCRAIDNQPCIECNQFTDANGVTVQKWIPVTERLPEEDGEYLVFKKWGTHKWCEVSGFAKDGRKVDKYDFRDCWKNAWYKYDSEYGYCTTDSVTHWMPLPEPPKGE